MNININDLANWGNLPANLQELLSNVQRGNFPYPKRERDWQWVQELLENGKYDLAQIQLRQDNLRQ